MTADRGPAAGGGASVVVPARDAAATLPRQLDALAAQVGAGAVEVVVADNGSTDGTARVVRQWAPRFACLRLVDASGGTGPGHARNAGVRCASGDPVLFCDADDEVAPTWVAAMVAALRDADVVGGRLDLDALNPAAVRSWRVDPPMSTLPVSMRFLPYAVGASLGVRAGVHGALGGFDERFRGSHDDVEFCWRAQRAGFRVAYAPDAVVHYRLRQDVRSLALQRYRYGQSYAKLHAVFREAGVPRGRLRSEAAALAHLLRRCPELADARRRGRWVYTASWTLGRWRGSVREGVLCPP